MMVQKQLCANHYFESYNFPKLEILRFYACAQRCTLLNFKWLLKKNSIYEFLICLNIYYKNF